MKHKFIISPFSRAMRNGKPNPKNYPYWGELVLMLTGAGVDTLQIGVSGEPDIKCTRGICDLHHKDLLALTLQATAWISVDNFFPHFCHYHKIPGIVIWGKSDPNIFGYPENINIIRNESFLRPHQFATWEDEPYQPEAFSHPQEVFHAIQTKYDLSSIMSFNLDQF